MFRILNEAEHEALCRRCGMSCHTPILLGEESVIIPEIHCRFLGSDSKTGESYCTVYERRFEAAPWCKTANEAARLGALAWDCPYATGLSGVKGKRWANEWEREIITKVLRACFVEKGLPLEDSPDSALNLLNCDSDQKWTYVQDGDRYRFLPAMDVQAGDYDGGHGVGMDGGHRS